MKVVFLGRKQKIKFLLSKDTIVNNYSSPDNIFYTPIYPPYSDKEYDDVVKNISVRTFKSKRWFPLSKVIMDFTFKKVKDHKSRIYFKIEE